MERNCDIDVIILSWNRTDETIAAIDSALRQEGVRLQLHIVDQGSKPAHIERVKAFVAGRPNVNLRLLGKNVGVPEGRNLASAMGTAPIIAGLDNDAEFASPFELARAVQRFASVPKLGAIGFRILNYFTGEDDLTSWAYPPALWSARGSTFSTTNFVGAGHAIRRSAFEAAGRYDGRLFFACEEFDLGLRMLNAGYEINYVPEIRVLHKISAQERIGWRKGRLYYTVRNNIYVYGKFSATPAKFLKYIGGQLMRAAQNGLLLECVRGIFAGLKMKAEWRPTAEERRACRLSPAVWRRVSLLRHQRTKGVLHRLRLAIAQGSLP